MLTSSTLSFVPNAHEQHKINNRAWRSSYLVILATSAFLGVIALRTAPTPFTLPFLMLIIASLVVVCRPVIGIHLIVFFAMLAEASTAPWYPFGKNLSSGESILFVNEKLFISPFEILIGLSALVLVLRILLARSTTFVRGSLLVPMAVFTGFLFVGFLYGLATGGDRTVALWELRPILYMPITYVLITNYFTSRRDYERLAAVVLVALFGLSLLALQYLSNLAPDVRDRLEGLVGHQSAVHMNIVILFFIASWVFPRVSPATRIIVPIVSIPIIWVYLVSQRRAAIIALAVGVIFLGVMLKRINPRALRRAGPIVVLIAVGYLLAFWNSVGLLGFPAQAIKSVIAPGSVSDKDQSSDIYRVIENIDIYSTIRARPITGIGFGQKFYRPIPLPDISFFPFYEYIPHNSVLWIWMKAGIGGFVAMLVLMALAMREGVRAILHLPPGRHAVITLAAVSYIPMYLVFTYVDISWDGRSMLLLGVVMAICSEMSRLPAAPTSPSDPVAPPPDNDATVDSTDGAAELVTDGSS